MPIFVPIIKTDRLLFNSQQINRKRLERLQGRYGAIAKELG